MWQGGMAGWLYVNYNLLNFSGLSILDVWTFALVTDGCLVSYVLVLGTSRKRSWGVMVL